VVTSDVYFNLSGVTYSTAANIGTINVNYYRTSTDYDVDGRQNRSLSPTGTITRTFFDALGRDTETWVGTNDTPMTGQWSPTNNTGMANMFEVATRTYDGDMPQGIGDGNLTGESLLAGATDTRTTAYYPDWRDRTVASSVTITNPDNSTHQVTSFSTLDNLGQATIVQQFDGTPSASGGVVTAPAAGTLRGQTNQSFDDQGRVYQTQVFEVNQSTGSVSSTALTTNTFRNHRGQIIATLPPGGLVTKSVFDGAGRTTIQYLTDGAGGSSWSQAASPAGDNVLEQTEYTYDQAGNTIETVTRQRNHDETATGALGNETTSPKARVAFTASYFDFANRLTGTVDVGTNGGTPWTRPSTLPNPSDTQLVTSYTYSAAGDVATITDPRGIVTQQTWDGKHELTQTIEDYTNGTPTANTNKTTNYTYDGLGHTITISAVQPSPSPAQTTKYVYGVTGSPNGMGFNSNDVLAAVQHPDKTTGMPSSSEQDTFTYNALGQVATATDRNGSVHTYSYDVNGDQTVDSVTTLGTGVDGSVRRLETAYDTVGRPYLFTSWNTKGGASDGGSIVNQVQDVFNGFGQLTQEYQAHAGAVVPASTPSVQYAYSEMSGGANHSRPITLTYPNGRVINYNYAAGVDNTISRLSSMSDTSATLENYTYLGLGTVVKRGHPQPGVDLTYIKQSGESNGDAGDQYTGLDRFGRVVDQRWLVTANGTHTDRFQYGYDRDGNRPYRNNLVNTSFGELYHASGAGNGYDNLNQIQAFSRGVLSASGSVLDTISSPTHSQSWTYDALGNMSTVTTDSVPQARTFNQQNEVLTAGTNSLAFDSNGNTTTDDQGHNLIYDAWNRLVQVKSGTNVLATYTYDALGHRVVENSGGSAKDLYYSPNWQVLEERVGTQVRDQYVWSPVYVDATIERDRDPNANGGPLSERLYVQQDANWDVTAVVNTSGMVIERYVEDPFGLASFLSPTWSSLSSSQVSWVYLHQGYRFDGAVGFFDGRMRVYSPTLGRWLQVDPAGFGAEDTNLYRAEADRPTSASDPSGRVSVFILGTTQQKTQESSIRQVMRRIGEPGSKKKLITVPASPFDFSKISTTLDTTVKEAVAHIEKFRKANKNEPVYIFGYSRGAVAAIIVARKIKNVAYVGLIDPVPDGLWPAYLFEHVYGVRHPRLMHFKLLADDVMNFPFGPENVAAFIQDTAAEIPDATRVFVVRSVSRDVKSRILTRLSIKGSEEFQLKESHEQLGGNKSSAVQRLLDDAKGHKVPVDK
jgi:RHS repeat-associated protein